MTTTNHPLLAEVLENTATPCLSLYLPVHRTQPERRDDQTKYRALVRRLKESLEEAYTDSDIAALLQPFHEVEVDERFWNSRKEGVAILASPTMSIAHHLDRPVPELAIVAGSFHLKPLLKIIQTQEVFNVLTVTQETVKLYRGDRDGLHQVKLAPTFPDTLEKALGTDVTEPHMTMSNAGDTPMRHSHSTAQEQKDIDKEHFFRIVSKALHGPLTTDDEPLTINNEPLILAGLAEHMGVFHKVSKLNNLMLEGITTHPNNLSTKDLASRGWAILKPYLDRDSQRRTERFIAAASKGMGMEDPREVAEAIVQGRVELLMVEATRQIPGVMDPMTGDIDFDDLNQPDVDDLLDDMAEIALKKGSYVQVLPSEYMPTGSGVAAILRW